MNLNDAILFQEKMDKVHRAYLCRMLNTKNIPDNVIERYAEVKTLMDRIDGHLNPGNLAMIIVSAKERPISIGEKALAEAVAIDVAGKVGSLDEPEAKVEIDGDGNLQPDSGATEEEIEQKEPEKASFIPWANGMPVRALHNEEIKDGKIVNVQRPSKIAAEVGAEVKLTIEFEGGITETYSEDEVEAD